MTAEIAILNKRGIALAADSALTIGKSKTMNSSVKLFTLDSAHFIGIMIYGNANLMTIPWEVVVKTFREELGNSIKDNVYDYVNSLIKYIIDLNIWEREGSLNSMVYEYQIETLATISNYFEKGNDLNTATNKTLVNISDKKEFEINFEQFNEDFAEILKKNYNDYFNNENEELANIFVKCIYKLIISNFYSNNYTGLVISGYGSKQLFPSIYQLVVDGVLYGKLKYRIDQVNDTDPLKGNITTSIMPFAQQEMVHTVITGIDPELNKYRTYQLRELKKQLINKFGEDSKNIVGNLIAANDNDFEAYRRKEYTDSVVNMLDSLTISEMGSMAETLVSLTSFKRKFSGAVQTVGGPIDVLTISRGEGPVWIKRKKYFDGDLNNGYNLRRK